MPKGKAQAIKGAFRGIYSGRGVSIVLVIFAIILFVWVAILVFSGR